MVAARRPRAELARRQNERIASVVVQDTFVPGRIFVDGVGEFLIDISFAVTFTEKPLLIPGATELEDDAPSTEHFPHAEIGIVEWKRRETAEVESHYTGATVAVRVAGRTNQRVWVTYAVYGKAFTSLGVEGA